MMRKLPKVSFPSFSALQQSIRSSYTDRLLRLSLHRQKQEKQKSEVLDEVARVNTHIRTLARALREEEENIQTELRTAFGNSTESSNVFMQFSQLKRVRFERA